MSKKFVDSITYKLLLRNYLEKGGNTEETFLLTEVYKLGRKEWLQSQENQSFSEEKKREYEDWSVKQETLQKEISEIKEENTKIKEENTKIKEETKELNTTVKDYIKKNTVYAGIFTLAISMVSAFTVSVSNLTDKSLEELLAIIFSISGGIFLFAFLFFWLVWRKTKTK